VNDYGTYWTEVHLVGLLVEERSRVDLHSVGRQLLLTLPATLVIVLLRFFVAFEPLAGFVQMETF